MGADVHDGRRHEGQHHHGDLGIGAGGKNQHGQHNEHHKNQHRRHLLGQELGEAEAHLGIDGGVPVLQQHFYPLQGRFAALGVRGVRKSQVKKGVSVLVVGLALVILDKHHILHRGELFGELLCLLRA